MREKERKVLEPNANNREKEKTIPNAKHACTSCNPQSSSKWCSHSLSLIRLISLLQELPEVRPSWCSRTGVLTTHHVCSHLEKINEHTFEGDLEKKTAPYVLML